MRLIQVALLGAVAVVAVCVLALSSGCGGGEDARLPLEPAPSAEPATPLTDSDAGAAATAPVSAAKEYFLRETFDKLGACTGCHSAGTDGASLFLHGEPDKAYEALDGNGLIIAMSPLLTKGPHAAGKAAPLDPTAESYVRKWLELEGKERVGAADPTAIYTKLAGCMSKDLFQRIDLCTMRTQPRLGENGDTCTGCDFVPCANCHALGGQGTGFWCSVTLDNPPKTNVDDTFESSKNLPYLRRYFGLSGKDPVPSHAIANKSLSTRSSTSTSAHPWYELDAARKRALETFVNDAITKYASGACP